MKRITSIFIILLFVSCIGNAQKKSSKKMNYKVLKTDTEWKKQLTDAQYKVLRKAGTERPYTSKLNDNFTPGTYVCAACGTPLYKSDNKFDSHCGWPSFDQAIVKNIELDVDYKIGYARTELKCKTCGSHLGHSFDDGPKKTTGKRHCVNGVALKFIPEKKEKK